jgi:autophagy-related protein 9
MMASNFMSRLLPSASDEDHGNIDHDDMAIDEENLGGHFEDQDLQALLAEAAGSEISEKPSERGMPHHPASAGPSRIKPKWAQNKQRGKGSQQQDQDDEVPASLMLEGQRETSPALQRGQRRTSGQNAYELPPPIPGPATGNIRAQWEATKRHQQLHEPRPPLATSSPRTGRAPIRMSIAANPKEKALWKLANVEIWMAS